MNKRCEVYENAETSPWVNQLLLVHDVVLNTNFIGTQPAKVNKPFDYGSWTFSAFYHMSQEKYSLTFHEIPVDLVV